MSSDYTVIWACPVADIVAARRRGRANGRGRVELYFRDASMCAVVVGVLTTTAADSLLTELGLPTGP